MPSTCPLRYFKVATVRNAITTNHLALIHIDAFRYLLSESEAILDLVDNARGSRQSSLDLGGFPKSSFQHMSTQ